LLAVTDSVADGSHSNDVIVHAPAKKAHFETGA